MVYEFRLPDIGEGVAEGEVVKWLVKEGEPVKENQPLVEIMTETVNVGNPFPQEKNNPETHGQKGRSLKVGQALLSIEEKGEQPSVPGTERTPVATKPSPPTPAKTPTIAGPQEIPLTTPPQVSRKPEEVLATPATRKLARDLGVDLSVVQGTSRGGRITDEDVQRFKQLGGAVAAVTVTTSGPRGVEERVPLRGIRRKVAEHMLKSKNATAQVTHVDEVDMTEVVHLRERAKPSAEKRGVKLTYLPFVLKALIPALKQYPYLNSSLDDEKEEIVLKKYYNIGIATDTESGLVVPVVKDADHKSITQLATEIATLSEKAHAGQLALSEVQGSTFTITNVGGIGGVFATPIINYPEVAILGLHKITKRPIVKDNQITIRDMTYLSLSFDHRVLDGAMAARFVNTIKQYLEDPKLLLLETD